MESMKPNPKQVREQAKPAVQKTQASAQSGKIPTEQNVFSMEMLESIFIGLAEALSKSQDLPERMRLVKTITAVHCEIERRKSNSLKERANTNVTGIVTYGAPDLRFRKAGKLRKRKSRTLTFSTNLRHIANIEAIAEAVGETVRDFISLAVHYREMTVSKELGIEDWNTLTLSRAERKSLAHKYQTVGRYICPVTVN
jgi:hypothetical protein